MITGNNITLNELLLAEFENVAQTQRRTADEIAAEAVSPKMTFRA